VKGFNYLAISQSDAESIKDSIATGRALENGMVEIVQLVVHVIDMYSTTDRTIAHYFHACGARIERVNNAL
jgi:hypothetical protein